MLVAAAILGIAIIAFPYWQQKQLIRFIRNADRVELVFDKYFTPAPPKTVLTDPEDIRRLVLGLELDPKEPCECAHNKRLIFWRGDTKLEALICDHCFDVITHRGNGFKTRHYKMPPEFYSRFRELESQYRNRERPEAQPSAAPDAPRL